jgi:hypothetical protein
MGMRETPGSMRAYFILVGLLATGANAWSLPGATGALYTSAVAGLIVGLIYLVIGFRLEKSLAAGAQGTLLLLKINVGLLLVAVVFLVLQPGFHPNQLWTPVLSLAITGYLYFNLRRLAAETKVAQPRKRRR